ncbi:MAG: glycosyl transferase [uncultured bacterium]|nr:MAG: glycosyl transferase [uncultured bacterium]
MSLKKAAPSISIVIATFNSGRTLGLCLEKVNEQNYDKRKIETIIADGGSRDSTLKIAKDNNTKIVKVNPKKQNAEYNKGIGLKYAKNEIVLFLDHDNIIPHSNWLNNIVEPFMKDKEIIGVEPLRFHYDPKMTSLDRYFALFGGSDPVVYYLGKASHLSYANSKYNLFGKSKDMGSYYKITFSKKNIPALGGNGAALKKSLLLKYAKSDPDNFIHTDVVADLIKAGHNKYGIIKDTIIHLTDNKVLPFLSRRKYFIEKYQLEEAFKRRYYIYDPKKDRLRLLKYIILSITIVIPLKDSIKGFVKIRDLAWFLHPFMCLAFLVIYSIPVFKGGMKNVILGK